MQVHETIEAKHVQSWQLIGWEITMEHQGYNMKVGNDKLLLNIPFFENVSQLWLDGIFHIQRIVLFNQKQYSPFPTIVL